MRAKHPTANYGAQQLQQEINMVLGRLRHLGGPVVVEELSGAIGDNSPFADEVDDIQAILASRDIKLPRRRLLAKRVNRLSDVTTGLLQKANDAQLAGVLAHEHAHDATSVTSPRRRRWAPACPSAWSSWIKLCLAAAL